MTDTAAAELRYGSALRDRILGSFHSGIQPVAVSPLYRLGLLLVTVTMVLLPLIYVGLVGLAGYAVYYHATHHLGVFQTLRAKAAIFVYGAPLVIGVILVFFMIKPLFARPARQQPPRTLRRADEPLLFAFVARICAVVGAPVPKRIDADCQVNASASFRRGVASFFGRDLVLTLGLPLVGGLSLQQLAGVLAHEFGHFAQGAGMRLTYLVRGINHWFVRVVYERDSWDEQLEQAGKEAGHAGILLVVHLARFFVWLTRRMLWALMWIGHVVSCFMLRQMEFDADRYEARLVGGETFESTCRELTRLGVSYQQSLSDLSTAWQEGRLADSLPAMVGAHRRLMDAELLRHLDQQVTSHKTGLVDTHPADKDRIAGARREGRGGVFRSELPATALFRDFPQLAAGVSLDFYRANLGDDVETGSLHGVDEMMADRQQSGEEQQALARFFQGAVHPLRPLRLAEAPQDGPPNPGALLQRLEQARQTLLAGRQDYAKNLTSYDDADTEMLNALQAEALITAGLNVKPEDFGLTRSDVAAAQAKKQRVERRFGQLAERMGQLEDAAAERLQHALRLLEMDRLVERDEELGALREARQDLLDVAAALGTPDLMTLRSIHATYGILGAQLQDHGDNQVLIERFGELGQEIHQRLSELRETWRALPYPFAHADEAINLGDFIVPGRPDAEDPNNLFRLAGEAISRGFELEMRVAGRLAAMGERLEGELGLEPLETPEAG